MRQALRLTLFGLLALVLFRPAAAQVSISVNFAPPALPVYEQPVCPEDGYIWVPGYWAWDPDVSDYYWVPGTWVPAPETGYLWTPPWWGWENGAFLFHDGFWATEVGFYGGIDYGFGYFGHGYEGGRWQDGHFFYNRSVTNINVVNIRNVYNTRVENNYTENHVSYNGGEGGLHERPTPQEEAVEHARHLPPPSAQQQQREAARSNPQMRASANQGRPAVAATARPGEFSRGVVAAKAAGAPYHPPANRREPAAGARPENENTRPGNERPAEANQRPAEENQGPAATPTHARELQPHQVTPVQGNSAADRKYQQQQQKLVDQQNKEHQKLAQQQEKEDQRAQQQHYAAPRQQQLEQKHQQQTQQMEQRHAQQQQRIQPKEQAPRREEREPREPK